MSLLTGLLSFWKLDGDALDSLGSRSGTVTSGGWRAGKLGQGFWANSGGKIDLPPTMLPTTGFTVSAWVRGQGRILCNGFEDYPTAFSGFNFLINGSNNPGMAVGNNTGYALGTNVASLTHSGTIDAVSFWHVVGTWDGSTIKLYINAGTPDTLAWTGGLAYAGTVRSTIGYARVRIFGGDSDSSLFTGDIDEVGVWDRALSPAEVAQLYNGGAGLVFPFVPLPAAPPSTDSRLTPDANLIGYWGFDETLETDVAIDESPYGDAYLSVTTSPSVVPGRVGNARTLTGGAFASLSLARLRVQADCTLMGSFRLNSLLSTGSQLRCLLSSSGPLVSDVQLFALYVDFGGRLVYKHTSASGEVVVRTAPGTIRINQFYTVAVVRSAGGTVVEFHLDNFVVPVADVTVNAIASAMPVPAPSASSIAVFNVGRSQKETDTAPWDGLVDEISLHDVARPNQPYLRSAYFRAALRTSTMKLSASNSVVSVSSSDMGFGVRWWCYERDKDLFVVKESPFGRFGLETRLTTPGGVNNLFTSAGKPELVYDPATDTLLVLFVAANRIYKLTASSTDDPATINMPLTGDVGAQIKLNDFVEGTRMSNGGGGQREFLPSDMVQNSSVPVKLGVIEPAVPMGNGGGASDEQVTTLGSPHRPNIAFMLHPSLGFGFVAGPADSSTTGYLAFYLDGGAPMAMAAPTPIDNGNLFFVPISSRKSGRGYYVQSLAPGHFPSTVYSDVIVDRFNEPQTDPAGGRIYTGRDGDGSEGTGFGNGGNGVRDILEEDFAYVNRSPQKISDLDSSTYSLGNGGGGITGSVTQNSVTVDL